MTSRVLTPSGHTLAAPSPSTSVFASALPTSQGHRSHRPPLSFRRASKLFLRSNPGARCSSVARPCKKPLLSMDSTELEGRPRQPLMLKEWLELEYSAELSRDGFVGCYPRHLATDTEPRNAGAGCSRRRRNGDVVARVSAAVRAALSRPPSSASVRQGEAAALLRPRSLSTRLRVVGFWKKRRGGELEEMDSPVASCSAAAASSGRKDGASSPAATSPRRMGRESRQASGGDRVGLSGGRRSHDETVAEGCECEATCHLDEKREREREQRLSPVSVMEFLCQDGDHGCNDNGGCDGHSEDEGTSPTFERSLANIRRASGQQLLPRIQRFEQLVELDTFDMNDAATTTVDDDTSCHVGELDSAGEDEDTECGPVQQDLPGLPEASSPCAAHCFKKLLEDFFREGLSSCHAGGPDDSDLEMSLLETGKAWLDGRHCCVALRSDQKAEVEEIERLARWRCFREDEHELLGSDVEGGIFCYLMEELVDELY